MRKTFFSNGKKVGFIPFGKNFVITVRDDLGVKNIALPVDDDYYYYLSVHVVAETDMAG